MPGERGIEESENPLDTIVQSAEELHSIAHRLASLATTGIMLPPASAQKTSHQSTGDRGGVLRARGR